MKNGASHASISSDSEHGEGNASKTIPLRWEMEKERSKITWTRTEEEEAEEEEIHARGGVRSRLLRDDASSSAVRRGRRARGRAAAPGPQATEYAEGGTAVSWEGGMADSWEDAQVGRWSFTAVSAVVVAALTA
ncbi:unnamed protein product, partial [Prorocentrum cordatum]